MNQLPLMRRPGLEVRLGRNGVPLRALEGGRVYSLGALAAMTLFPHGAWLAGMISASAQERHTELAIGGFFLSMATVVIWLTVQLGKALPHRKVFLVMSVLYAGCGAAEMGKALGVVQDWPVWAFTGVQVLLPAALVVLSLFMFGSIPPLLAVLRASNEVQTLRGQAKLRALVQAAPMAVLSTDCDGRITSWNPAAERIFGWTEKEILGVTGVTVPPETRREQYSLLERTLHGEIIKGFETVRFNRAGERLPVSISMAPLHDEEGALTGVMATIEDIRERKRIERDLQEKSVTLVTVTEALNTFLESGDWAAASKQLLSHVLEQTGSECGFLGVVLDGPLLRVLAHQGLTWDDEINRQLYDAKMSQQAAHGYFELSHHENLFDEILSKGKTVVANQPFLDPRSGGVPPGHPRMHNFLGVPIFKGTTVVGVIAVANRPGGYTGQEPRSLEIMSQATGVLYDNYRQNLNRVQLEEQRVRLEGEFRQAQKMEVLGQLSGGIAHDFNNMLMVLSGAAELLEKSLAGNSPANRYVEQIRRTVERAAGITRQLLAFSRKQILAVKPTDLHEALTECEFMLPRLLGADVQLTFQHKAVQSWIRADTAQLEQVIANLAINARDAMPGGGTLTISTRNAFALPDGASANGDAPAANGWVVLEVKDTGSGMDEETRRHIFEPFFTTKPVGKGTGLGLPSVYGIVRQFGGHVYVESKLGEGACFQLYFPVQDSPLLPQTSAAATVPEAKPTEGLTILLADDEASLRAAVAQYLRGAGHKVLESNTSHDAVEIARSHAGSIDVLITDVVMPGLRGPDLAQKVAEFRPEIPVIYISGYAQSFPEAQIPAGAAFLQKPFRFASLAEQLKLVTRKA